MMNRMAHLRWWADRVRKGGMVGPNADYGIRPRSHVSDGTRRRDLDGSRLARVSDAHVRMALRLQAAFGLRREEAIKLGPSHADRGDCLLVKASTAKGGRPRHVPVRTAAQRRLLDEAPAGGPPRRELADRERRVDAAARLRISRKLGHGRLEIVRRYRGWRSSARRGRPAGGPRALAAGLSKRSWLGEATHGLQTGTGASSTTRLPWTGSGGAGCAGCPSARRTRGTASRRSELVVRDQARRCGRGGARGRARSPRDAPAGA